MKLAVIGSGRWGTFIAWYLCRIGHDVTLFGRQSSKSFESLVKTRRNSLLELPDGLAMTDNISRLCDFDTVIISVGSQSLRGLMEQIRALGDVRRDYILCMKGIECGTGLRLSEVVSEYVSHSSGIAVWVGPGHVQEFASGIPNCMVIDSENTELKRWLVDSFSQAIRFGTTTVEDAEGVCCHTAREVKDALDAEKIPVLPDETAKCKAWLHPDVLVDGILAKKNLGTKMSDAPLVIALGPGFCAGRDCHAVIETMRGHTLGRVIWDGEPLPNTNIPGLIGGFAGERVLRAPDTGVFHQLRDIGALVESGETVGEVNGLPMVCTISGVLRGILPDGTPVTKGMKSGDVDPRGNIQNCYTVSDKASAIAGGVLEAILHTVPLVNRDTTIDLEGTL